MTNNTQTAYLAGGCFWGMEELVGQIPGVIDTEVGYTGGNTPGMQAQETGHASLPHPNPLPQAVEGTNESLRALHFNAVYEQVKTGTTGHAESLKIVFNPAVLTYRHLLFEFFRMHNPTTRNQQGNDVGTQYRSAIFYLNEEQHRTALEVIKTADDSGDWKAKIVTELVPYKEFFRAEEYHQKYLVKHRGGYTCHYIRRLQLGETN